MHETIPALMKERAALGENALVVVDDKRLSYKEADRRSRRIASTLIDAGVGRGSRVAMLFGNGPEFAVTALAVMRLGAVAMPISTLSTPHELRGMLRGADAEFFIATPSYRGKDMAARTREAVGGEIDGRLMVPDMPVLRQVWLGTSELEEGTEQDRRVEAMEAQVTAADPLFVIHTSGSTSAPKGVTHTHGQVLRNMARLNAVRGYGPDDCLLSNSPWFWVGGMAFSFLATLIAGGRLVCSSAEPEAMLDLIEQERPTITNGVAATMLAVARAPSFGSRDLSFMRRGNLYPIMPVDARPVDPDLRYGMLGTTEAGSVCLIGPHERDLPETKRGSFGYPVEGIEIRIVDPDSGKDADNGELWMRGANLMQGYYGRERHECFDEEGWYHSGDIVSRDADGDIFFKGRQGDIVRTSGAQVSPREVEAAIGEATGGRMALVIGLPDPERGQLVTAVMVGNAPVDEEALRSALKERLAPYKIPRKFVTMEEGRLPTVSSGKIDLRKLVEIVGAA